MVFSIPDQVIYGQQDCTDRQLAKRLLGARFALWPTGPMPAGITTDTVIQTIRMRDSAWAQLHLYLVVTSAANVAGDTLDLYVDASFDGGVTWYNVVHFNQLTGTMAVPLKNLAVTQAGSGSYTNVSGNQAAGLPPANWGGDQLRLRGTLVNTSLAAAFTFGVYGQVH